MNSSELIIACPKCGTPVYKDEVACTKCRFVIRYFCESCNTPILISKRFCPKCGIPNPRYDGTVPLRNEIDQSKPSLDLHAMETEFDSESQSIAKEIEGLKEELKEELKKEKNIEPVTQSTSDNEILIKNWDAEVILHSDNPREPIHVGLGTNPEIAKGIPGTLFVTNYHLIFLSRLDNFEDITNIFSYICLAINKVKTYRLGSFLKENRLEFTPHGYLLEKYPSMKKLVLNFSWSSELRHGTIKNQIVNFRMLLTRLMRSRGGAGILEPGTCDFQAGLALSDEKKASLEERFKQFPKLYQKIDERYDLF
ncbi:MAG: zinc ribbon domain-containing protein [Promethearchaeota archaeon]